MFSRLQRRLSYANVMATVAVFLALAGTSWAVATNNVGTAQLRNHSVTRAKLATGAVGTAQLGTYQVQARNFGPLQLAEGQDTVAPGQAKVITATCPRNNTVALAGGFYWKGPDNSEIINPVQSGTDGLYVSSMHILSSATGPGYVRARAENTSASPAIFVVQADCLS